MEKVYWPYWPLVKHCLTEYRVFCRLYGPPLIAVPVPPRVQVVSPGYLSVRIFTSTSAPTQGGRALGADVGGGADVGREVLNPNRNSMACFALTSP